MFRIHHRRAGLSLMEALVALFIMAIGMISLLTLFPLGAIQMGRALRDDRCAQCAWQADATVRVWWQVEVVDKMQAKPDESTVSAAKIAASTIVPKPTPTPYWDPLDGTIAATVSAPGMVVAIDPIGWYSGRSSQNLGGTGSLIVRASSGMVTGLQPSAIRACSLMDDIYFNDLGQPDTVSAVSGKVVRQGRYNWMALIQRPVNNDRTTANLKILVFDGRPPGTNPAGIEQNLTVSGVAAVGNTQVTLNSDTNDPNAILGKGGWLLDATGGTRMDFYRIQSITANGTTSIVELDTPIKGPTAPTQMIALRGLAEVFDRPILAPTGGANAPVP